MHGNFKSSYCHGFQNSVHFPDNHTRKIHYSHWKRARAGNCVVLGWQGLALHGGSSHKCNTLSSRKCAGCHRGSSGRHHRDRRGAHLRHSLPIIPHICSGLEWHIDRIFGMEFKKLLTIHFHAGFNLRVWAPLEAEATVQAGYSRRYPHWKLAPRHIVAVQNTRLAPHHVGYIPSTNDCWNCWGIGRHNSYLPGPCNFLRALFHSPVPHRWLCLQK